MTSNDEQLLAEIRRDEGVVNCAYQDSLGYWTIGVGRLIDKRKGGCLSDTEIDYLLSNDIDKVVGQLNDRLPWWSTQTPARQRVLVNMAFNLGINGLLGFKNTLKAVQAGDYKTAAAGIRSSTAAKQTGARYERLAVMMENG